MAEALLRARLAERGIVDVEVSSAGELEPHVPATDLAVATLADRGIDLSEHRSRSLTSALLDDADLVLGLGRHHVCYAASLAAHTFTKTFVLKELVRRGNQAGRRMPDQSLADWLALVGRGRDAVDLLGDDEADDVADPIGKSRRHYKRTAAELDALLVELIDLAFVT